MRDVSIVFHLESAERPASNPCRYSSSVSPRGVLIDIPVTAIRSVFNKIHLQNRERADGVVLHDLSRANCGVIVLHHERCSDAELLPGSDFGKKRRMVDTDDTRVE